MLDKYGQKRDFARTPEPPPEKEARSRAHLTFVVQKHAARSLHYDFRLELGGVLKSWAIPAGPSLNPRVKRLAIMVEDHPMDYASFEGVIPPGQYGSGEVIVWDTGTYSPAEVGKNPLDNRVAAEEMARKEIAKGKLSMQLHGHKLKGSWALVRMRGGRNPKGENWLLIKHADEYADMTTDLLEKDRSVLSGLTIDDLKTGRTTSSKGSNPLSTLSPSSLSDEAHKAPFPTVMLPMLATLADAPFSDPDWVFEPKLDGFRMISFINRGKVRIQSRNGIDDTEMFPAIAESLTGQAARQLVLDGEVVALENGRPCFQCLQQSLKPEASQNTARPLPIVYYVFDLLYLDSFDLCGVKLEQRKALLDQVLRPSNNVQLVSGFRGNGEAIYQASVKEGIEGIVAKRLNSTYSPGRRSRDWLKIKASLSDEFIIAGYTPGQGARTHHFGALLLGQYNDNGELVYAGNVGTGFDERLLKEMKARLDAIKTTVGPPFESSPPHSPSVIWVRPELVAEVKFAQWTHDGMLRAPVFMRLRDDKPAREVHRTGIAHLAEGSRLPARGERATSGDSLKAVLDQLGTDKEKFHLEIGEHRLQVSNLDKPLWPASGKRRALTKRDLLNYLTRISPYVLPHLKDRPLTLTRYPDGIRGERFYQKHYDDKLPAFVETVPIFSEHDEHKRGVQDYMMCNNLATLLWLGQIADLEIHAWFSRTTVGPDGPSDTLLKEIEDKGNKVVSYPDFIVFDLDPYIYAGSEKKGGEPELNRKAFHRTAEAALWLKEILDELSLSAFVKTTGKTGIHVYVPILRQFGFRAMRSAAETIGRQLLDKHPEDITMEWAVEKRTGKIFVDHNRNARGQTLASVYSPRPSPEAAVSMPLRWDELGKAYPTDFTILNSPQRLEKTGDLWADILDKKGDLKKLLTLPKP